APLMARLREPRPALPGARALIDALRARRVPIALCTASYRRWVDAILPAAGLAGLFDAVSAADDAPATKPDPAPYLLAARMLGVAPERCIAIEDSANGLTSALASGACVIQLRATSTAAPPIAGVARIIESLREFPLEWVAG
ncbi:MAG TPA: HAD family hydrolase, partial [Steroidobacteraceae bacterium]|nr:HAD family hydrolase [Steroidobacteraceae bacterium]